MTTDEWLARTAADRGEVADDAGRRRGPGRRHHLHERHDLGAQGRAAAPREPGVLRLRLGRVRRRPRATEAALVSVPPYHIAAVANVITNLYAGPPHDRPRAVHRPASGSAPSARRRSPTPWSCRRCWPGSSTATPTSRCPSLRSLAYGGAPMPAARHRARAAAMWPDVDFVNAYGLTETSSTIAVLGPDDHRAALASATTRRCGPGSSVGRPLPGVELRDPRRRRRGPRRRPGRPDLRARRPGVRRVRGHGLRGRRPGLFRHPGPGLPRRRRLTCSSAAAPTTRSSAARRTSRPPRSRTSCCGTRR